MKARYNPETGLIENAREAIDGGRLPKGWAENIMNKILYQDKKEFYKPIKK